MSSVDAEDTRMNDILRLFKNDKKIINTIRRMQPNPHAMKDVTYEEDLHNLRTMYQDGSCAASNKGFMNYFLLALKIILFDSSEELDYKMWASKFDTYMMEHPKILDCFNENTDWNRSDVS